MEEKSIPLPVHDVQAIVCYRNTLLGAYAGRVAVRSWDLGNYRVLLMVTITVINLGLLDWMMAVVNYSLLEVNAAAFGGCEKIAAQINVALCWPYAAIK
ncbi:hypothetical protein ACLOJK_027286 [Asimina triloba]